MVVAFSLASVAHTGHKVGVSEGHAAREPTVKASPVRVRSASHTDQSSGVVADERRREDSQPGGEWEVSRAHEASGRSRWGCSVSFSTFVKNHQNEHHWKVDNGHQEQSTCDQI